MNVLVIGGTRFMGKHLINALLEAGDTVTIATRGKTADNFGDSVSRLILDASDYRSMKNALSGKSFDLVFDNIAYCSNDIKNAVENVRCGRFVTISSAAVYRRKNELTEEDFVPSLSALKWCARGDYPYDEIKRQAENALFCNYNDLNAAAVRFPYVIGGDDYTARLYFYAEHIVKGMPIYVDNMNEGLSFIFSDTAGKFLAFLGKSDYRGAINASEGVASPAEIIEYVEKKKGKMVILSENGDPAPYNGDKAHSLSTEKAKALGFSFESFTGRLYALLDEYIVTAEAKKAL